MQKPIRHIIVSSVIGLLIFSSCSKQKNQSQTEGKPSQRKRSHLTIDKLYNATYFNYLDDQGSKEPITLKAGRFERETIDSTDGKKFVDHYSMNISSHNIAFGDLRGDSSDDAALCLAEWTGGSGIFISLNAVVDSNGTPYNLARFPLGDRIRADSVYIQNRIILVKAIIQRDGQGACCPDSQVIWQFRLENNELKELTGAQF